MPLVMSGRRIFVATLSVLLLTVATLNAQTDPLPLSISSSLSKSK